MVQAFLKKTGEDDDTVGVMELNTPRKDFDSEAANWDTNLGRVKMAGDIADSIIKTIGLTPTMDIMDFGCGTGLLTLNLNSLVHSVMGVDSSQGMLDVLNEKIRERKLANVETQYIDLDQGKDLNGRYDVIVSAMAFHHIKEIGAVLRQFYKILAPGGIMGVADLDLDGGKFHESNEGVFHFGFDRGSLRRDFLEAGFKDVADTTAAELVKPGPEGETRKFTIFLVTGRKARV
ncbi:MAG: class I SAM-dependent DNA methyltransferase [Desulfomonilaceae bacterium]